MHRCAIVGLLLLAGCVSIPKKYHYTWGTIVAADGNTLARTCSAAPAFWDDGRPKARWEPVGGCFVMDGQWPEYWIEDSCYGWMYALRHELAHGDGVEDPKAAGY